jgi:hypothetical protein
VSLVKDTCFRGAVRRAALISAFMTGLLLPRAAEIAPHRLLPPAGREIARLPSPNMRVDALLIETRRGPFSAGSLYEIYVVTHGAQKRGGSPVWSAIDVDRLKLTWDHREILEIGYGRACVRQFRSYSSLSSAKDAPAVTIHLAPASEGFSCLKAAYDRTARAFPPAQ